MEFPIENQEQFDAAVKDRLAREKEKWNKESGESEAQAKVAELEEEIRTRDARAVLSEMNVTDQGRQDKILRLSDLPDDYDDKSLRAAFKSTYDEIPEAFPEGATVKDKGLDTSGSEDSSGPLTEEQIRSMPPEEINSNWDRVKAFLGGER